MRQSLDARISSDSDGRRTWLWRALPAIVIVAVTATAYAPAIGAGFIWDDDSYVTDNPVLAAPDGLSRIWFHRGSTPQYYPLVFTTFRLEYRLWGLRTSGYHAVNILLHAVGAVLLWRILAFLRVPGAWAAALIFAVHPVQVESVAWVTELKNVLSGVFYLAALWAALKFYVGAEPGGRRWTLYACSLLLFACALFSKTVTCSLPAAILLILWWRQGRVSWKEALTLAPFFILGMLLALNTVAMESRLVAGGGGDDWNLSFLQRCLIAGRALWFYAGKLVWPVSLTFIYPRWQVDARAAWQYLFPVAALAVLAALWLLRRRLGRGPLAAALFFTLTLSPALGFINVFPMRYSFVADHFQYLACIGLIVPAAATVAAWRRARGIPTMLLCAAVVAVCAALTWRQTAAYRDAETLWRDTIAKNPSAPIALDNLGDVLVDKSMQESSPAKVAELLSEAVNCFDRAIALKPDDYVAYNDRGRAYARMRQYDLAIRDYDKAIALKPDLSQAYNNRGNVYLRMRRLDFAISDYNTALLLNPDFAEVHNNRAMAYFLMREYDKALADLKMLEMAGGHADPEFLRLVQRARGG
jgi:tetratricopeptide (TPR) repeat protein